MQLESPPATDASREVVDLLVRAFEQAARRDHPTVGTEHLLLALLDSDSAPKDLLGLGVRDSGSLMGVIKAKGTDHWASRDGADDDAPAPSGDPVVMALLREVEWQRTGRRGKKQDERPEPETRNPQPTPALAAALTEALRRAHDLDVSWAGPCHVLMGLLGDRENRASEALLEQRLDRDEFSAGLDAHQSARENGTPHTYSLDGLRNMGMLGRRGKYWGGVARVLSSGGFGSPIVPTVKREAVRQAVRLGHSQVTTVHLLLAVLALDGQLTAAGERLRTGAEANTGADLLRDRGVTFPAALDAATALVPAEPPRPDSSEPEEHGDVGTVTTRARLRCHERKDPSTGTTHLLAELLADPAGPCTALLASLGVDTEGLRRTLDG